MKPLLPATMIVVGGLLFFGPVLSAQKQKARIAEFYAKQGNGALLPDEMRPHDSFDWICLVAGGLLTFAGVMQAARSSKKESV